MIFCFARNTGLWAWCASRKYVDKLSYFWPPLIRIKETHWLINIIILAHFNASSTRSAVRRFQRTVSWSASDEPIRNPILHNIFMRSTLEKERFQSMNSRNCSLLTATVGDISLAHELTFVVSFPNRPLRRNGRHVTESWSKGGWLIPQEAMLNHRYDLQNKVFSEINTAYANKV